MPTVPTIREQVESYAEANNFTFESEAEILQAVDLVENHEYDVSVAVEETGHPELPTG